MKRIVSIILALTIAIMAGASPAMADRRGHGHRGHGGGRVGFGVVIGPGWFWPGGYSPYPYYPYYPQSPVIVERTPEIYVQPAPETPEYWYFCPDPQGYYPYIPKCPKGWLKVVPPTTPPDEEE